MAVATGPSLGAGLITEEGWRSAFLLVNSNRTVSVDRIIDDLWGEDAPESAPKMVQIYVSKLHKVLAPGKLRTRPPGYSLQLEANDLDLHRFESVVAEAGAALDAGHAQQAADRLREALALWRGPALAEFSSEPFAQPEGARLEELRMAALEWRLEADLALGHHRAVVSELEALTGQHPLRERLRSQHMLALYRSGRHAEALASYQGFRRKLADELGIEPSVSLREFERRILLQDPSLELPAQADTAAAAASTAAETTSRAAVGDVAYARSGDIRIAYQMVGDGPVDLVLVHGLVCTFQPGWEYPKLAAFYRQRASMGRLILFDKRGTGLSDRVSPEHLPDLEHVRDHTELDPLFRDLLRYHWMDESRHAKMDTILLAEVSVALSPVQIDHAIDELLELGMAIDGLMAQQVELDLDALQGAARRALSATEQSDVRVAQRRAYRWTFLVSGLQHPKFTQIIDQLTPHSLAKIEALSPLVAIHPVQRR